MLVEDARSMRWGDEREYGSVVSEQRAEAAFFVFAPRCLVGPGRFALQSAQPKKLRNVQWAVEQVTGR